MAVLMSSLAPSTGGRSASHPVGPGHRGLGCVTSRSPRAGRRIRAGPYRQATDGPGDPPGPRSCWASLDACVVGIVAVITAGTLLYGRPPPTFLGRRSPCAGAEAAHVRVASALFAALTSMLGKVVSPSTGTAVRTLVVLAMAWVIVAWQGEHARCGRSQRDEGLYHVGS